MSNPGNSGVTRYGFDTGLWSLGKNPSGPFVRYTDYADLEERCKRIEAAAFTEPEVKLLRAAMACLNRQYVSRGGNRDFHYEDQIEGVDAKLRAALTAETAKGEA